MIMQTGHNTELIYGNNAVLAVLTSNAGRRKVYRLFLTGSKKKTPVIKNILSLCQKKKIQIVEQDKNTFELNITRSLSRRDLESTQGIALEVSSYNYYQLDNYLQSGHSPKRFLVMLDGITDVGNFGSIIRNVSAFEADGIIIGKNRSAQVNQRVTKTSAGALENTRVFRVTNLARSLQKLKDNGFWIYGSEVEGSIPMKEVPLAFPLVIVLGSEGKGISNLTAKMCDYLVKIDMSNNIQSLNVSVASGILMHWVYQEMKQ